MVMTYVHLRTDEHIFRKLTGFSIPEFERFLVEIAPPFKEAEAVRLSRTDRLRAEGGGNHAELEFCDQVLLTMIWLRLYPKQEVLGDFFGISQPTVWRCIARVEPILAATRWERLRGHDPGRKRRHSLEQLLIQVPELLSLVSTVVKQNGNSGNCKV